MVPTKTPGDAMHPKGRWTAQLTRHGLQYTHRAGSEHHGEGGTPGLTASRDNPHEERLHLWCGDHNPPMGPLMPWACLVLPSGSSEGLVLVEHPE